MEPKERLREARQVSEDLLVELESGSAPVAQSLMKAKRLARLLRDQDAQSGSTWRLRDTDRRSSFQHSVVAKNMRRLAFARTTSIT
jgi:hypothetical protein